MATSCSWDLTAKVIHRGCWDILLKRTKAKTLPFNEKYKTADLFSFIEDEIDKLKSKKVRWEIDAQQLLDEADALRRRAEEGCRLLTKANVIRQAS